MSGRRILLVEDEAAIQAPLVDALAEAGYIVDVAASIAEAWPCLDAHPYALVIADWRLPDGDGTLIADAAAQLGAATLVMSGYLSRMPGGRVEQHPTMMKPFPLRELVAAVEMSIGKSEVR